MITTDYTEKHSATYVEENESSNNNKEIIRKWKDTTRIHFPILIWFLPLQDFDIDSYLSSYLC